LPAVLIRRMDLKSSYLLKIKLIGNPKTHREDCSCYSLSKIVDSDTTNFKDLIDSIVDEFPPGYEELVTVQYHDEGLESFPQVENDKQLMNMFEKYNEIKVVCIFVLYSNPTEPPPLVTEWSNMPPNK
jgi:hypothetical protein